MKLITLNTHSIVEPDYEEKLYSFSRVVLEERPEILALQEVNQTVSAEPAPEIWLEETGYLPCGRREGMEPAATRMCRASTISPPTDTRPCPATWARAG